MNFKISGGIFPNRTTLSVVDMCVHDSWPTWWFFPYRCLCTALMQVLGDNPEILTKDSVISSQIDWLHLQTNHKEHWIALARKAFENLDINGNGEVDVNEMITCLQNRLSAHEVEQAFDDAVAEGAIDGSVNRMDFASFMRLMKIPSFESLDLYDDRHDGTVKSFTDTSGHNSSPSTSYHNASPSACASHVRHATLASSLDISSRHSTMHSPLQTVFENIV